MFGTLASGELETARLRRDLGFSCGGIRMEGEQTQKLVVGYALTSKKKKSFLQPKLEVLAR